MGGEDGGNPLGEVPELLHHLVLTENDEGGGGG